MPGRVINKWEKAMAEASSDVLIWHVRSVAPNGSRSYFRRVFEYEDWQFAERYAQFLRNRGHEDVRVQLASRDGDEE